MTANESWTDSACHLYRVNITIELMVLGVDMFLARLRLILARAEGKR